MDMLPFIGAGNDETSFVIQLDVLFDFLQKNGIDKKAVFSGEETKIDVPLDIALSLLSPEELEKLKNYITSYKNKHYGSEPE